MRKLLCLLDTIWGNVTMPAFWATLVGPTKVRYNGHVWPHPTTWGEPTDSPYGMVQYDVGACARCGGLPELGWRRWWGA